MLTVLKRLRTNIFRRSVRVTFPASRSFKISSAGARSGLVREDVFDWSQWSTDSLKSNVTTNSLKESRRPDSNTYCHSMGSIMRYRMLSPNLKISFKSDSQRSPWVHSLRQIV